MSDANRVVLLERGEKSESHLLELALEAQRVLGKEYPRHVWIVTFQGGALIVRHALINAYAADVLKRDGFGFVMPKAKMGSVHEIGDAAREAGGQMLELFHMKRGAWDGEEQPQAPRDWVPKQQKDFA